jgi:2-iminobutanoate/2-iminopropanoate deaminase
MSTTRRVTAKNVPEPAPGLWSNCKIHGDQVFISGMVALEGEEVVGIADPYKQTCHVFGSIKALMEAAGGTIDDVIKMTIFITDMRHRPQVLEARRQFFTGDYPCSTLVGVSTLIDPRLLVEIEVVGFIAGSGKG